MYQTEPTFIVIACRGSLRVIKGVHPLERANKTMSKPPFIASTNKVKPSAKSLFQHKWRGGKKKKRGGGNILLTCNYEVIFSRLLLQLQQIVDTQVG